MSAADRKAVRARLHGRVQGVWFRAWACEQAGALGLDGWVRNRADGTVEAVFAGPPDMVDRMVVLCRCGPPLAKVSNVRVEPEAGPVTPGFHAAPDG
ncbi:MAG: acylphosphatase [Alphaproteobacteria bacterium]